MTAAKNGARMIEISAPTAPLITSNVTLFEVINGAVGALISIILAPFFAAVINVIYIDLRVRKEGANAGDLVSGSTPTGPPPGIEPLRTGGASDAPAAA